MLALMYVIGTAGHVDHGKSTLVQALTGIDPDRLAEEKQRGMTIDLGFAWLTLPSGREVSIVDVPGHERFIKNMLAGVGGIDLALVVVAADESVMPQTREHLAILDLLRVSEGIAVITKSDLVDPDLMSLVQLEVEELLSHTTLAGAPIYSVSATTGEGIEYLAQRIDVALNRTPLRRDVGRPRLPVDRSFSISGFGTVVTGTLIDGQLAVGQSVEIVPSGLQSRVRGLQSHQQKIESSLPGNRVAVNLGGISQDEVTRGEVITVPGWLKPTHAIDVRLHLLEGAANSIRHNHRVTFHAFAAESPAKVRLLDADELGANEEAWAQIWLEHPIALIRGDRFVIRSSDATLGGGDVIDTGAKRHRRYHAPTLDRLARLADGTPAAQLVSALEGREPADVSTIARRANLGLSEALNLAASASNDGLVIALGAEIAESTQLYTTPAWARLSTKASQALASYHSENPLRPGMTREELRSKLGLKGNDINLVITRLANDGVIVDSAQTLRLPDHSVTVTTDQSTAMETFVRILRGNPFPVDPPTINNDLLGLLAAEGRIVRAAPGVVFETSTYERLRTMITDHLRLHGKVTVAEARDILTTSRKYALALLEHLDEEKITRRLGDERVLLKG